MTKVIQDESATAIYDDASEADVQAIEADALQDEDEPIQSMELDEKDDSSHVSFAVNHDLFDRGGEDDGVRFTRAKLKVRTGCELESSVACDDVPAGAAISILDRTELPDGTKRALVSLVRLGGWNPPIGWVSEVSKDGRENLLHSTTFRRRGRAADERRAKPAIAWAQSAYSTHSMVPPRPYWEAPLPVELAEGLTEPLTAPVRGASQEHVASLESTVTTSENNYKQQLLRGFVQPAPAHASRVRSPEPLGRTGRAVLGKPHTLAKAPLPKEAVPGAGQLRPLGDTSSSARLSVKQTGLIVPVRNQATRRSISARPYWENEPNRNGMPSSTLQIGGVVTCGPFGMPPASEFNPWTATSSSTAPLFDRDPFATRNKQRAASAGTNAATSKQCSERLSLHRWQWVHADMPASVPQIVSKRQQRALALEGARPKTVMAPDDVAMPQRVPWKTWYTHVVQK